MLFHYFIYNSFLRTNMNSSGSSQSSPQVFRTLEAYFFYQTYLHSFLYQATSNSIIYYARD